MTATLKLGSANSLTTLVLDINRVSYCDKTFLLRDAHTNKNHKVRANQINSLTIKSNNNSKSESL